MRTRTRHNKVEFRRWSWRRISFFASGWSSGGRKSGLGDKSCAPAVSPGHHGFGSEVIRNNRPVRPSKSAMRFQRAAQRRSGLTPPAMDNTDAPVVKIRAKWSPKNMYIIDNKALIRDDFVKLGIAQAPGNVPAPWRADAGGHRHTRVDVVTFSSTSFRAKSARA